MRIDAIINSVIDRAEKAWPSLVSGIAVFLGFWIAAWLASHFLDRMLSRRHLDEDLRNFCVRIVRYGILTFGIVTTLGTLGIDVRALVAGLGLTSFVLGLALKDIVSNVASGILLLVYRPFTRGENIAVVGVEGKVVSLSLRYTTLQQNGKTYLVPNSKILTETVQINRAPTNQVQLEAPQSAATH